jgi:hypothetical protein
MSRRIALKGLTSGTTLSSRSTIRSARFDGWSGS